MSDDSPLQRRFSSWNWAEWRYTSGLLRLEKLLDGQNKKRINKSKLSGTQLERDVWVACKPLADAGIEMYYQYRINGGEYIADIFLCRVKHGRYGGRNVILSIKDMTGSGSHDRKIVAEYEAAKIFRIPMEVIVLGNNISMFVQSYLAEKKLQVIYFEDVPAWAERVAADQSRPDEDFVRVGKKRSG